MQKHFAATSFLISSGAYIYIRSYVAFWCGHSKYLSVSESNDDKKHWTNIFQQLCFERLSLIWLFASINA